MDSENANVTRAAGVVGAATMASRVFGFLRDMVVASLFGASIATDAFFVAFRIPNLLRRLLGEGSLTVSFVPVFTEYLKNKSHRDALDLASIAFTILSMVLVVVSVLGVLLSPLVVTVMAPGFRDMPEQYRLAVFLTRLMFPYIFFISLVALCMGILNSLRHFAVPALSPVVLNIAMILCAVLLHERFAEPIVALAVGVLIGGLLQLVMQWPILVRMGVRLRFNFAFRHPGIRAMGVLLLPTLLGSAVYQINIFLGTILASLLPKGSVSYLYYADRIVELPLGVFAIAVGTASLPSFSTQVANGDTSGLKRTIAFSLRLILFVTIPATVALLTLRVPILSVLFERGAFSASSTLLTAQALLCYTLGLWAFSVIRVIDAAFFAIQDRRSPLKAAVVALVANFGLSVVLMFPLKHAGIALATSIATAINVIMLAVILKRKIGPVLDADFYRAVSRIGLASLWMWLAIILAGRVVPWDGVAPWGARALHLAAAMAAGGVVFLAAARWLRLPEFMTIWEGVQRKLRRGAPAAAE
jgi:putative peptidoglycan lipid II flippase